MAVSNKEEPNAGLCCAIGVRAEMKGHWRNMLPRRQPQWFFMLRVSTTRILSIETIFAV
jgi:hypothetical protein